MIKRIALVGLVLAIACGGGGGDITPPPPPPPPPTPTDISTMAVGEVRTYTPSEMANGLDLPTISAGRDYVIIVGNTSPVADVGADFVVKADQSTGASFGLSVAPDLGPPSSGFADQVPMALTAQQALENKVRAFERRNLGRKPTLDQIAPSGPAASRSVQVASPIPAVGDRIGLKIPDANSNNLCTNYITTLAEVASVSARAILAVDTLDGPPLALFTPAQMDSITQEFDNITFPTAASYFANPTDIDGNGRVIILFTGEVNKLTPPGNVGGFVAGFFFAGDFFPTVATPQAQGCPQSNQAEIFYLLSPDPAGRFGNVRTTSSVRQGTRGTIAHEFQHMINTGTKFQAPVFRGFESTWLDEALAHLSEDAVGRAVRGFTDLQTLTFADVLPCNSPCSQANDFNAFFFQNLARLTDWMNKPDQFSPTSGMADTSLAVRGAAWALVRYAADNYSNGNPRNLTRALVAGPDTGVANFVGAANSTRDVLVKNWLVSMYADHLGVAGLDPLYQYRSWNFRSVMPPVARTVNNNPNATYPLVVTSIGSGSDNISSSNRSGTGRYFRLNVPANSGAKNVKVLDPSGAVASFQGAHVYVLRVQ